MYQVHNVTLDVDPTDEDVKSPPNQKVTDLESNHWIWPKSETQFHYRNIPNDDVIIRKTIDSNELVQ